MNNSSMKSFLSKYHLQLFFFAVALESLAANFAHPITPTLIQNLQLPDYPSVCCMPVWHSPIFFFLPSGKAGHAYGKPPGSGYLLCGLRHRTAAVCHHENTSHHYACPPFIGILCRWYYGQLSDLYHSYKHNGEQGALSGVIRYLSRTVFAAFGVSDAAGLPVSFPFR